MSCKSLYRLGCITAVAAKNVKGSETVKGRTRGERGERRLGTREYFLPSLCQLHLCPWNSQSDQPFFLNYSDFLNTLRKFQSKLSNILRNAGIIYIALAIMHNFVGWGRSMNPFDNTVFALLSIVDCLFGKKDWRVQRVKFWASSAWGKIRLDFLASFLLLHIPISLQGTPRIWIQLDYIYFWKLSHVIKREIFFRISCGCLDESLVKWQFMSISVQYLTQGSLLSRV